MLSAAWAGRGGTVGGPVLGGPIRATADERIIRVESDKGPWSSAKVEFFNRSADHYRDAEEPSEAFGQEIADTLEFVARWIDERRAELEGVRSSGLDLVLLFDL